FRSKSRSSRMEGMTFVTVKGALSRKTNKPLVYVNYLSAAPWNDRLYAAEPEYRLAGSLLLAQAAQLSMNLGYGGRLGLHALGQSEGFYRRCGMIDYAIDENQNLRYFEFSEEEAKQFLHTTELG